MIIINDEQFMEGIIGGLGWIIAVFYIRNSMYLNSKKAKNVSNIALVGAITWAILWIIRKIGMNLYVNLKKFNKMEDKNLSLPFSKMQHVAYFLLLVFFILYMFVFNHPTSKNSNSIITRLSTRDLPLIIFIALSALLVYI